MHRTGGRPRSAWRLLWGGLASVSLAGALTGVSPAEPQEWGVRGADPEGEGDDGSGRPSFSARLDGLREGLERVPGALEERQEKREQRREFVEQGMRPRPPIPILSVEHPEAVLGPLPRPSLNHDYFDPRWQRQLDLETGSELTAGNVMQLLPDRESWQAKVKLARSARESLFVTTMVMTCDEGGKEFTRLMIDSVRRGIDTRFIIDALFSFYATPCLAEMRAGGVKVAMSTRSIRLNMIDWEMHEKYFIVDGQVAVTGGQNVGSWYHDATGFDGNYRDTDLLLAGPVVRKIARRFVRLWEEIEPEDRSLKSYSLQLDVQEQLDARRGLLGRENYSSWLSPGNRQGLCRFVSQDPHLNTFHVWRLYQAYVEHARHRVMFSAYALDPQGSRYQGDLRTALLDLAAKRDATVDIITNGYGVMDNPMVPGLFRVSYGNGILRQAWKGFGETPVRLHVYHYFIHSKQYYFDGIAASVGSFNYDASGNRCQESTVICMDPGFVNEIEMLFARDIANSWRLSGEDIDRMEELEPQVNSEKRAPRKWPVKREPKSR